ncbi:MAG: hypothetical protein AAF962_01700 [Actinomycetota bacterium]
MSSRSTSPGSGRWRPPGTAPARLADGRHVRLRLRHRWGAMAAVSPLPDRGEDPAPAGAGPGDGPTVAVTLARLRLGESLRFMRWGTPVERQVRRHPGLVFGLAAVRPHHTLATFTMWRSDDDMWDLVGAAGPGDGCRGCPLLRHPRSAGPGGRRQPIEVFGLTDGERPGGGGAPRRRRPASGWG